MGRNINAPLNGNRPSNGAPINIAPIPQRNPDHPYPMDRKITLSNAGIIAPKSAYARLLYVAALIGAIVKAITPEAVSADKTKRLKLEDITNLPRSK